MTNKKLLVLELLMEHKNIKKSVLNDKKYIKNDYKGVEIVLFKPKGGNIPPTPIQVETEQFISEAEK